MRQAFRDPTQDPLAVRIALTAIAVTFIVLFLFMPLSVVFCEALSEGFAAARDAIADPDALSAIRLTLVTAAIAVPLNMVFGICAAWAIAKFDFCG